MAPDQNRLPRLIDGLDLRALPIGPAEAFVLSRVDGGSTEADIAAATGLDPAVVAATLARLVELGAVRFEARPEGARRVARTAAASGQYALGPLTGTISEDSSGSTAHPGAQLYDPAELDEPVDLDPPRRKYILDTYYRLENLNHYELLGADPSADKRAIKARYYEVVNLVHPDRYYGKQLGGYKAKLEKIFQRLTEAHEVLTRPEARAEYDDYLRAERRTQALDRKLNDAEAHARELRAVQERIEAEARAAEAAVQASAAEAAVQASAAEAATQTSSPGAATPPPAPAVTPESPKAPSQPPPRRASLPAMAAQVPVDAEARRRALARKLGHLGPAPARAQPTAISTPQTRERAASALQRHDEQRRREARGRQVSEYVTRADSAVAAKSLVDAVNALRIAATLAPDDLSLKTRLGELERQAAHEIAACYLEQAKYEEREKRWAEAARSYARSLAGSPNARVTDRLAHCVLNAQGDPKRALEAARAAVLETPSDARYRITLARAYLAMKMRESAMGELERAATLAPGDDSIKEQIRRVKRGEV